MTYPRDNIIKQPEIVYSLLNDMGILNTIFCFIDIVYDPIYIDDPDYYNTIYDFLNEYSFTRATLRDYKFAGYNIPGLKKNNLMISSMNISHRFIPRGKKLIEETNNRIS
jgi:hypothetical protein